MSNKNDIYNSNKFKEALSRYKSAQDQHQTVFIDLDDIIDIAEYYNESGAYDDAVKANEYALTLYPGAAAPLAMLARAAMFGSNDIKKAKAYADMIDDKDDLEYIYLKAEIMIMEENVDGADAYLESKMNVLDDESVDDMLLDVPFIFLDYKYPELAQKWLTRCNETDAPEYKAAEGEIALLFEDYEKSETIFKKLLEDDPFSSNLWNKLAMAQFSLNHMSDAIESCEFALAINPNDKDALMTKANSLASTGKTKDSCLFYKRYIRLCPDEAHARMLYGLSLSAEGQYDDALQQLYIADKQTDDKQLSEDIIKEQAYVLTRLDKHGEALLMLDNAEKAGHITHNERLITEGYVYLSMHQDEYAKDCFMQAFINTKMAPNARIEVAIAYFECSRYQQTYDILVNTLTDEAKLSDGYSYLAYSCRMLYRHEEFIKYLKKACDINPREALSVLKELFPDDCQTEDFVAYALKHDI